MVAAPEREREMEKEHLINIEIAWKIKAKQKKEIMKLKQALEHGTNNYLLLCINNS